MPPSDRGRPFVAHMNYHTVEAMRAALRGVPAMMAALHGADDALVPWAEAVVRDGDGAELAALAGIVQTTNAMLEARTVLAEEQAAKLQAENVALRPITPKEIDDADPDIP